MMNEITYTNEKKDFTDFARFSLKIPRCISILLKRVLIVTLIITIIGCFLFIKHFYIQSITFILLYFLFNLIFLLVSVYILSFIFNGHALYNLSKGLDLNYTLTLTDEGIKRVSSSSTSTYNWSNVKDIYNTKREIFVFVSDFQAIIIPKRAFENEADSESFYNLIIEYQKKAHSPNAC